MAVLAPNGPEGYEHGRCLFFFFFSFLFFSFLFFSFFFAFLSSLFSFSFLFPFPPGPAADKALKEVSLSVGGSICQ